MEKNQPGFTLVEIMVVVVILGLLATLVVPNVFQAHEEAKRDKARADVSSLESTIDMYLIQGARSEPPTWEELIRPDPKGRSWLEGVTAAPRDPYGNEYELRRGDGTDFEIRCWGPDGLPDTDDDISSRSIREH